MIRFVAVLLCLGLTLYGPKACADQLDAFISMTCDPAAGTAMLRFAYADGGETPVFRPITESPPTDLSRRPVPTETLPLRADRPEESQCDLPGYGVAKARFIYYPWRNGTYVRIFSVWFGQTKVLSRIRPDGWGCPNCLIHSVLIDRSSYRICDFKLGEDNNEYDLSNIPVRCDLTVHYKTERDTEEYPTTASANVPPVGSIVTIVNHHKALCDRLVVNKGPDFSYDPRTDVAALPEGTQAITLKGVGTPVDFQELFRNVDDFPGFSIAAATLAFGDDQTRRVYKIHMFNGPRDASVFLMVAPAVPPGSVISAVSETILGPTGEKRLSTGRPVGLYQLARSMGWPIFAGFDTPYAADQDVTFTFFHFENSAYLLLSKEADDPTAIVVQPDANGSLKLVCTFQQKRPNL